MQEISLRLFNFQQNSRREEGSFYFRTIKLRCFFIVLVAVVLFLNKIPAEGNK